MPFAFIETGVIFSRNLEIYKKRGLTVIPLPDDHPAINDQRGWSIQNGELVFSEPVPLPPKPLLERLHPDVVLLFDTVAEALDSARVTLRIPTRQDLLVILTDKANKRGIRNP